MLEEIDRAQEKGSKEIRDKGNQQTSSNKMADLGFTIANINLKVSDLDTSV